MVHLRLLRTPPRGDALSFGFRPENVCLKGTPTPLIRYTLRRTGAGFQPAPENGGVRQAGSPHHKGQSFCILTDTRGPGRILKETSMARSSGLRFMTRALGAAI